MSKQSTDSLFRLIQSMTRSEKRYLKKHAQRHVIGDGNLYVKLFDALNALDTYDEKQIISKFPALKSSKQLSTTKSYLFNLILNSLDQYEVGNRVMDKVTKGIQHTELLFRKGLIREARKMLVKTKKLAREFEKMDSYLKIYGLERTILLRYGKRELENGLFDIYKEEQAFLKAQRLSQELIHHHQHILLLMNMQGKPSEERRAQIDQIVKEKFLNLNSEELMFMRSIQLRHEALGRYYFLKNDIPNVIHHLMQIDKGYEHRMSMLKIPAHLESYIRNLNNLVLMHSKLGNDDACIEILERIKQSPKGDSIAEALKFYLYHNSQFVFLLPTKRYAEAAALIQPSIEGLKKHGSKLEMMAKLVLNANLAQICLIIGEYDEVIERTLQIQNLEDAERRKDIYNFSVVMNCIAHYELDNSIFLSYQLETYIKKYSKDKSAAYEVLIFKMLKELIKTPGKADKREVLSKYRSLLLETPNHFADYKSKEAFTFVDWIDSKLCDQTYAEYVMSEQLN